MSLDERMDDPTEQVMEGPRGRGRRASGRPQNNVEDIAVPGTQEEVHVAPQNVEDASNTEGMLDEASDPHTVLPSDASFTETSPYFPESMPETSTRRLRPRTFRSPIKVPPLLLSRRVTRSSSTTTPRAPKHEQMAPTNEETPEKSKSTKTSKTPKQTSSKKSSTETSEKPLKDTTKTPSKRTTEKLAKSSTKKAKPSAVTPNATESDLALKYGNNFDWEEYASFCMRRTRLSTDPSVTTAIENIRLYGNWRGENGSSSLKKTSDTLEKQKSGGDSSTPATAEPRDEKRRTKEERRLEKELKKQRKEERRKKKEEKKLKKEREGESKKKHRRDKKKHQDDQERQEEIESRASVITEDADPKAQEPAPSLEAAATTAGDTIKAKKSRKRKSDDSATPKPKKAKKAAVETADVENASAVEESKSNSNTKERTSPAKADVLSTALETVSESVLNLGSNSPSKRIPAGTSIIVPPPVDADRFGLIQEEVCHNPYYLLIATVFLQKTKASSAIPVFREFLRRWPNPGDLLANGNMGEVKEMFDPLGLHTTRAKTVWMMAHHFHLLDPYHKPRGPRSWKVRRDYRPEDPTGLNRKWGCIIGDVYGCGTYAIDSWRIFCMKPGEGGFIDGTTVGKPQNRKTDHEDTPALPVVVYRSDFAPGDEEWRRISPDREVLDKELQAYIRWMHAKDAAGFGTATTGARA